MSAAELDDVNIPAAEELFFTEVESFGGDTQTPLVNNQQNVRRYFALLELLDGYNNMVVSTPDHSLSGKEAYDYVDKIQCLRHDFFHILVASQLGALGEEKPIGEKIKDFFPEFRYFDDDSLMKKTPDIVFRHFKTQKIFIIDVAISVSASVVAGIKEEKYKPVEKAVNEYLCQQQLHMWEAKFYPAVLDQNMSNLDIALQPFHTVLSAKRRKAIRIWVSTCNDLIKKFSEDKLSRDSLEKRIFYECKSAGVDPDKGGLVYPIPQEETLTSLTNNKYYLKASKEYIPRSTEDLSHTKWITDSFMKIYDKTKLFTNQIFEYPSLKTITESINLMEESAKDTFETITNPKPSLHFMMALTQRTSVNHDGLLDLVKVGELASVINQGIHTIGPTTSASMNIHDILTTLMKEVPMSKDAKDYDIWAGRKKNEPGSDSLFKGKASLSSKLLKGHWSFLKEWAGLGKEHEPLVTKVKSLAFWEPRVRENAMRVIRDSSMLLARPRTFAELPLPKLTGVQAVDSVNRLCHEEIVSNYNRINRTQASFISKQISETCHSILLQKKRESNNIQIINKGDRGMYVITLPHRMLETRKAGNTVPFFCVCLHKKDEELFNKEILEVQFGSDRTGFIVSVTKCLRLDVQRIESLSHSYELFNSVMTGWFISNNELPTEENFFERFYAIGFLFFLCHSVHLRTGGLLDNLRYMFMDVTAEKSNFKLFMLDNGKIALKNSIQVALYNRIREVLPIYSACAKDIVKREPEFDMDAGKVRWGSLGVMDVKLPSLIAPPYYFNSFMSATNEIVGLFFAVPKDLHGEFHKKVNLESTPFEWQCKLNEVKTKYLDRAEVLDAIASGGSKQQTVDLEFCYDVGRWIDKNCLEPRLADFKRDLGKLRLTDSILNHRQFTSSHSCIRKINEQGYAVRNKVLLCTLELIDDQFNGEPPSLWEFCIWSLNHKDNFRFVISPKGQRTMVDREIYIGNMISFSLRVVEKVFAVVCKYQSNEAIHIAGDKKFMTIQHTFRKMLDWSRTIIKQKQEKEQAMIDLRELMKKKEAKFSHLYTSDEASWFNIVELSELNAVRMMSDEEMKIYNDFVKGKISEKMLPEDENRELKIDHVKEKHCRELISQDDYRTNIAFLNGDRTKWSAADLCDKFCVFIDALHSMPLTIRIICKAILLKHDDKIMHISKDFHERNLELFAESPNDIIKICGTGSSGTINGNWFQGMLNYISSSFHSGVQELSWQMLRTRILKNIPFNCLGLCHSDDEIAFLGYGTVEDCEQLIKYNIFEQYPLETILIFHNILGSLGCMNYSQKKTNIHLKVSEFVSLFLIWGDQQFPFIKHLSTAISGLPGTGLDDDIYSALSQTMMAATRGCPLSALLPIIKLAQDRVDRMYSLGRGMTNDVEAIFKMERQYLPLEIGGTFTPGPLPLMLSGPAVHDVMLLDAALNGKLNNPDLCKKILKCFYALSPHGLIKTVPDDDPLAQEESYATTKLSGFTGMMFKNYMPKGKDDLMERFSSEIDKDRELEFMLRRPSAAVMKPSNGKEALMYWKTIITKPSWVRAMRKQGARGMAIKRAQWIRGAHVRIRHTEDWRTMRDCLQEISEYVNSEKELTLEELRILRNYTDNVSSSIVSNVRFLNGLHVTKRGAKPKDVRIATELHRPVAYRDVKNDVRKLVTYIWDNEAFHAEHLNFKFAHQREDDCAKIKMFMMPSFSKSNCKWASYYKLLRSSVLKGEKLPVALGRVLAAEKDMLFAKEQMVKFIHGIYSEAAWVYKQFEEHQRSRIVITVASSDALTPEERIISENCLRWSTLHVAGSSSKIKVQPTMLLTSSTIEASRFKIMIDTVGFLYKKLLSIGLKPKDIVVIFDRVGMNDCDGKLCSLKDIIRQCINYCISEATLEINLKKLIAIIAANLYHDLQVAYLLLANHKCPMSAWLIEQKHIGGGRYQGNFELICWIGDNNLRVTGTDHKDSSKQNWSLICRDGAIAHQLVAKAYKELFGDYHTDLRKLSPTYVKMNLEDVVFCRHMSNWTISTGTKGIMYIPIIQVKQDSTLLSSSLEEKIMYSKNGFELWQKNRYTRKRMRMLSIKHTGTNQASCEEIKRMNKGIINIANVRFEKIIEHNLLSNFLSGAPLDIELDVLIDLVTTPETFTTLNINDLWSKLETTKLGRLLPDMPDIHFDNEDFPALTSDESEVRELGDMAEEYGFGDGDDDDEFKEVSERYDIEWNINDPNFLLELDPDTFPLESDITYSDMSEALMQRSEARYIQEKGLIDPMFSRESKVEIYSDQVMYDDRSTSSGSSEITTRELYIRIGGDTLMDKLIFMSLNMTQGNTPSWLEFGTNLILEYPKVETQIRSYNKKFHQTLYIFEKFCSKLLEHGMLLEPEYFNKMKDEEQKDMIRDIQIYKKRSSTYYRRYSQIVVDSLLEGIYKRQSDVVDLLYS